MSDDFRHMKLDRDARGVATVTLDVAGSPVNVFNENVFEELRPDFTLLAFDGKELKKVSLHDYKGKKNVALAFFVFAFTGG